MSSALGAMHGFEDAELVVMDDEAPAAVREQLARLEGPRRVRHNLTGWFGIRGALAAGATCAEGEVLIFLAAEAQLAKGALEQICAAFDADPASRSCTRVQPDSGPSRTAAGPLRWWHCESWR